MIEILLVRTSRRIEGKKVVFISDLTRALEDEGAMVFVLRWHSILPKTRSEQLVPSVTAKAV